MLDVAVSSLEPRAATGGEDGRILIWDATLGRVEREVASLGGWVEHVRWSPDGSLLAATVGRSVRVFTRTGESVWVNDAHASTVSALCWASATELCTACYGCVTFLDAHTGRERQRLQWQGSLVSLALGDGGRIVACGSQDNTVHFWRRDTGKDSMMSGYASKPAVLCFDGEGRVLATSGGEVVTVWSFHGEGPEGTRPGVLEFHARPLTALSFTHRGRRLVSGCRDGAVVLWAVERDGRGEPCGVAMATGSVEKAYLRPDDRALAVLDGDGGVTVFRVG